MSKTIKEIIFEEFLTCSICMDEFQDPKVLKCLHTFCEECIQATIQKQIMTSHSDISCPICRTRIDVDSNGDYNLQTNFPIKNLLEIIKGLPANEVFAGLYKAQIGYNLSMAHIFAISETNQCVYLKASVDDLRFAVIELRRQIEQYKTDLEIERTITAKLSAQMVTKDNTIVHLERAVDDLTLKAQKEDPEKTVHDLAKSSCVVQIVHRCATCIEGFCRCFSRLLQTSFGWLKRGRNTKGIKGT
ncbi:tripartite motif-containing protein 3-like isoform X1 [Ruditapes philippinarum]|uniref:tripartite motif-containing protein 3-like isoform X1 n=1 Tax=Ruditapes philippinarum TaxID=129788 RepID=UPI00295AD9A6|nr:tripartite motif-containing protein 3-like isoform X1 [Ruditapes philippinarum]XP_060590062.1 tripartite motif-containing protein 3-like isoform X1 [Ruditapes philippinarum]XP_060590063.1 tripartite motif-containing protein 3-like isoform X1 [Ruditapes philippinarum]